MARDSRPAGDFASVAHPPPQSDPGDPRDPRDQRMYEDWLATASMGDPQQAGGAFLAMLRHLREQPSPPPQALKVLEWLHPRVIEVVEQHFKRFSGKALPLSLPEDQTYQQVGALCEAMGAHYRALRETKPGVPKLARALAASPLRLAWLRGLEYAALQITAAYAARRDVAAGLWQALHDQYAQAEQAGFAQHAIGEGEPAQTCAGAYAQPLLLALTNPYGLLPRDARWLREWAGQWSRKAVVVSRIEKTAAYSVDLGGDTPPVWVAVDSPRPDRRYLDLGALRNTLRKRLHLLAAGHSPAEAALGADCVEPAASRLLKSLLTAWSAGAPASHFPRRPARPDATIAHVAIGVDAAHRAMAGAWLERPSKPIWDYTTRGEPFTPSAAFGAPSAGEAGGIAWRILDESAMGFRLRLDNASPAPRNRIALQQLLAVRPHGATLHILADVRWLMQGSGDSTAGATAFVTIGTRALPGLPRACAVRSLAQDPDEASESFIQAFVLEPPRGLPECLVLPSGAFQSLGGFEGRVEVRLEDGVRRARLAGITQRGYDYECATLAPMA